MCLVHVHVLCITHNIDDHGSQPYAYIKLLLHMYMYMYIIIYTCTVYIAETHHQGEAVWTRRSVELLIVTARETLHVLPLNNPHYVLTGLYSRYIHFNARV